MNSNFRLFPRLFHVQILCHFSIEKVQTTEQLINKISFEQFQALSLKVSPGIRESSLNIAIAPEPSQ